MLRLSTSAALPRWIGWLGIVVGPLLFLGAFWVPQLLLLVWAAVVGLALARRNSHETGVDGVRQLSMTASICGRYAPSNMKTIVRMLVLAGAAYTLATKSGRARLKRARETYTRQVNSGSRPIEAVGTAVAAFVGRAPDGPAR